jgi:hypothetical protein
VTDLHFNLTEFLVDFVVGFVGTLILFFLVFYLIGHPLQLLAELPNLTVLVGQFLAEWLRL